MNDQTFIHSQGLPIPGRDGQYIDPRDLSTTPGGTMYAFTPGGTKITYDRSALLWIRNSPLARTPPKGLNHIPGVTLNEIEVQNQEAIEPDDAPLPTTDAEEPIFQMQME